MLDFNKTDEEILAMLNSTTRFFHYINEVLVTNKGVANSSKVKGVGTLASKWHVVGIKKEDFINLRLNEVDALSAEDAALVYKFAKTKKNGGLYEPKLSFYNDCVEVPEEFTSEVDISRSEVAQEATDELYNDIVAPMYNRALQGVSMDLYLMPDGKGFACRCEHEGKNAPRLSVTTFRGDEMYSTEEDIASNANAYHLKRIMPWKAFAYDMLKYINHLERKIKSGDCELVSMHDTITSLKCKLEVEKEYNDITENEIARLRDELHAYKEREKERENRFKWLKWFKK
jgi:hypothetical protein